MYIRLYNSQAINILNIKKSCFDFLYNKKSKNNINNHHNNNIADEYDINNMNNDNNSSLQVESSNNQINIDSYITNHYLQTKTTKPINKNINNKLKDSFYYIRKMNEQHIKDIKELKKKKHVLDIKINYSLTQKRSPAYVFFNPTNKLKNSDKESNVKYNNWGALDRNYSGEIKYIDTEGKDDNDDKTKLKNSFNYFGNKTDSHIRNSSNVSVGSVHSYVKDGNKKKIKLQSIRESTFKNQYKKKNINTLNNSQLNPNVSNINSYQNFKQQASILKPNNISNIKNNNKTFNNHNNSDSLFSFNILGNNNNIGKYNSQIKPNFFKPIQTSKLYHFYNNGENIIDRDKDNVNVTKTNNSNITTSNLFSNTNSNSKLFNNKHNNNNHHNIFNETNTSTTITNPNYISSDLKILINNNSKSRFKIKSNINNISHNLLRSNNRNNNNIKSYAHLSVLNNNDILDKSRNSQRSRKKYNTLKAKINLLENKLYNEHNGYSAVYDNDENNKDYEINNDNNFDIKFKNYINRDNFSFNEEYNKETGNVDTYYSNSNTMTNNSNINKHSEDQKLAHSRIHTYTNTKRNYILNTNRSSISKNKTKNNNGLNLPNYKKGNIYIFYHNYFLLFSDKTNMGIVFGRRVYIKQNHYIKHELPTVGTYNPKYNYINNRTTLGGMIFIIIWYIIIIIEYYFSIVVNYDKELGSIKPKDSLTRIFVTNVKNLKQYISKDKKKVLYSNFLNFLNNKDK